MRVLNAQLNVDAKKSAKSGNTYFVYSINVLDDKGNVKEIIPLPMDILNAIQAKKIIDLAANVGKHVEEKTTEVNIETW